MNYNASVGNIILSKLDETYSEDCRNMEGVQNWIICDIISTSEPQHNIQFDEAKILAKSALL